MVLRLPAGEVVSLQALPGAHNAENVAAAAACAYALDVRPSAIVAGLARLEGVPGRMQVVSEPQRPIAIVDYAHTPEALERALAALRPLTRGKLHVVFGCGGDRDAGKRPEMGRVAATGADTCWVTSDNPRSEAPQAIADDIVAGLPEGRSACVELDRAVAIQGAIDAAGIDDVVLIAGKGHESVQVIAGERRPFDDVEVARAALRRRSVR